MVKNLSPPSLGRGVYPRPKNTIVLLLSILQRYLGTEGGFVNPRRQTLIYTLKSDVKRCYKNVGRQIINIKI